MSASQVELELERGGRALVLETDGERVTLLAPEASPPGSTVVARLEGATDPSFRVDGRWVSLSRVQREALGLAPQNPDAS